MTITQCKKQIEWLSYLLRERNIPVSRFLLRPESVITIAKKHLNDSIQMTKDNF